MFEKAEKMTPEERLNSIRLVGVRFFENVVVLSWVGVIGWGEYRLELKDLVFGKFENGKKNPYDLESFTVVGDSEGLDLRNNEKKVLRHLLSQLADLTDLSEERQREADWEERQKNR